MSSYLQSTQKKFINPSENKHYLGYNPAKPCLTERTAPYSNPKGNASLTYNSVTPSRERAGIQEQGKIGLGNFLSPRSDNYQNIMPNQLNQTYANGTNQSANSGYFVGQNMKQTGYRTVFQEEIPSATNQSYNYQSNNPITHQNFNLYSRSTTNMTPNKSSENINIDRSLESSLERTRVTTNMNNNYNNNFDKQGEDIKKIKPKFVQNKFQKTEKKNGNNINATNQEILNKLKQLSKNPNANFAQIATGTTTTVAFNNAQTNSQSVANQNLFKHSSLAQTNQKLLTQNINTNQLHNVNSNNNNPSSSSYLGKQKNFQQQDNQFNIHSQSNNPINSMLSTQNLNSALNNTNSKRSVTPNGINPNTNQIQDLFNRTQLSNNLGSSSNNKQQAVSPIQQQMNSILQKVGQQNSGLGPQLEQQRQSVPILQSQLQQQQQQFNQNNQSKQSMQSKQQGNINLDRRFTPQYLPQDAFNQINDQLNLKGLEEQLNLKNAQQQNFNNLCNSTPNQKIQQQQQLQQTVQKRPNVNNNANLLNKLSAPNSNNTTNNNFFKMFNQQQRVSSPNINNNNNNTNQNNMMLRSSKQNQDDLEDQTVRLITGDESLNAIINNLDQSGQYLNLDQNNGYINQAKGISSSNQLPHSKNTSSNQVTNLTDNTNNNINNHHIYTNSSSMNSYNESQNELSQENLNQFLINNNCNNSGGMNSQNNLSRDNQSSNRQLVNNIQNKQEQEKLMMKLLQEKLGEKYSQYLMNNNNNQQQMQQKQYHSQGLPNTNQIQQMQLQQQIDLAQLQENETPRKINKSVPMATTTNQGQHYKVSDLMKEQNKKNNSNSSQNRGGLQKQIMEQILQSKIGQPALNNNSQQGALGMTPNQILKQQQQQANMLFESANQIENEIQQIWLQQQQQQNQLPDQISNYQISAPINALQQQPQGLPTVDYQVVDDYESNEGNSNNLSQNKLAAYQQDVSNNQLQPEQEFSQNDLNQIQNQQQQIPQPFSNNQNAFQSNNNTEPIDFDEFQNYIQTPNVQYSQQQYQNENEEQQQKVSIEQQQQQQQQLLLQQQQLQQQYQQQQQQFLSKNNNMPLASALMQNQQQIYQLQQQQQQFQQLQYIQQQQQYFNNPNNNSEMAKLAQQQQKLLNQQQIFANQLKSQPNSMNSGQTALQSSASQLLLIANQQKQQLQQQLLQNNLIMQQNNIQQQGLPKQNLAQINNLQMQQFQNQNIQQNVNANQAEIILGITDATKQLNLNDESISSTSSSKSQNNMLNKQQTQAIIAQQEVPKIEVEKLKQILSISLQVEECLFELLQNREFDYQAKYLIKYYQLMQEISSLQSLPISKIQMKEIQRSINMQIVLIQIIIYEHIVVIKQLRESVRGTVSMNENLQNILNSFQYVHSSFILILILFEQAVQYLKDQGEKQLDQLDLSGITNVIKERTKKRKMGFLIKNQDKISILKKFNDILQPLIQIVIEGQIELQEENRNSHTLYEDLYQIQENIPNLQIQQILDFSSKLSNENVQFMKDEISRLQLVQERKSIQKQLELEFQSQESDGKSSNQQSSQNQNSQLQNQAKQNQKQAESQKQKQDKQNFEDDSQKQQNSSQIPDDKSQASQKRQEIQQQSDNTQKQQEQQNVEEDLDDLSYKNPNTKNKPDQEENNSSSYQESSIIGTVHAPYLKDQAKKPYTLVIDLDETLVHYQELDDGGQFLVRPYAETFLEEMSEYYEIIIFTAALQDYADFILDIIDSKKSISYKLYRQHTVSYQNSYIKDLSRIGRDLNKIIIIDNLPENFKLQPENGIYIQSWYGESEDRALYDLTPLLKQIVKKKFRTVQSALKQFRDKIETNLKKGMSEPHLNLSLEIFSGDEDDTQR